MLVCFSSCRFHSRVPGEGGGGGGRLAAAPAGSAPGWQHLPLGAAGHRHVVLRCVALHQLVCGRAAAVCCSACCCCCSLLLLLSFAAAAATALCCCCCCSVLLWLAAVQPTRHPGARLLLLHHHVLAFQQSSSQMQQQLTPPAATTHMSLTLHSLSTPSSPAASRQVTDSSRSRSPVLAASPSLPLCLRWRGPLRRRRCRSGCCACACAAASAAIHQLHEHHGSSPGG